MDDTVEDRLEHCADYVDAARHGVATLPLFDDDTANDGSARARPTITARTRRHRSFRRRHHRLKGRADAVTRLALQPKPCGARPLFHRPIAA
ncbi:hypothetical protein AB0L13_29695 [Saccharopolyspora shandongensis]|uniref:hypothetical protein n=1 Tax=Saccharopolyspora shandongensis TaxID=418495 RepID=UPI00343DE6C3